jgi:hypothetical protein
VFIVPPQPGTEARTGKDAPPESGEK